MRGCKSKKLVNPPISIYETQTDNSVLSPTLKRKIASNLKHNHLKLQEAIATLDGDSPEDYREFKKYVKLITAEVKSMWSTEFKIEKEKFTHELNDKIRAWQLHLSKLNSHKKVIFNNDTFLRRMRHYYDEKMTDEISQVIEKLKKNENKRLNHLNSIRKLTDLRSPRIASKSLKLKLPIIGFPILGESRTLTNVSTIITKETTQTEKPIDKNVLTDMDDLYERAQILLELPDNSTMLDPDKIWSKNIILSVSSHTDMDIKTFSGSESALSTETKEGKIRFAYDVIAATTEKESQDSRMKLN